MNFKLIKSLFLSFIINCNNKYFRRLKLKPLKNNQVEVVLQYLKIESNNALIIDGKYGVGKTHFFKKCIEGSD